MTTHAHHRGKFLTVHPVIGDSHHPHSAYKALSLLQIEHNFTMPSAPSDPDKLSESDPEYPSHSETMQETVQTELTETIVDEVVYADALAQTISEDAFSPEGVRKLLSKEEEDDHIGSIHNNLLDTVDDADVAGIAVDFQPENTKSGLSTTAALSSLTESDPFADAESMSTDEANQLLQKDGIPSRYTVSTSLGKGGSGQVFGVNDTDLQREIAVKFLHPEASKDVMHMDRFFQEARLTASLEHPNILPVHELGISDGGLAYFTMRKAKGSSLADLLAIACGSKHIPEEIQSYNARVNIIIKVCQAIAFAHNQDVIHQDIKPGNIIIGEFGEVVLIDWGTAKQVNESEEESTSKKRKRLMGTPAYMAPEQARREYATKSSDIYCIGSTFYHLLTFQFPAWSNDLESFWEMKRTGFINPLPAQVQQQVPSRLLAIARKAMAPNPHDRYADIQDFINDLTYYQEGLSISAYRDTPIDILKRWYTHNKRVVWAACVGIVIAAIFGYLLYQEHLKELSSWKIYDQESFAYTDTSELADRWYATSYPTWVFADEQETAFDKKGFWKVKDGQLLADSIGFFGATNLSYRQRIPGDIAVEWDLVLNNKNINLNCFIGGRNRFKGYTIHVNGFSKDNYIALTKGMRDGILEDAFTGELLSQGKTFRVRLEKFDDMVQFAIDGKIIISYQDPEFLVGSDHQYFGFEIAENSALIDNVTIYNKPLPLRITPLTVGHSYYSDGDYTKAAQVYDDIIKSYPDAEITPYAHYRLARCKSELGEDIEALLIFNGFKQLYPLHELIPHVLLEELRIYLKNDNWDVAEKSLSALSSKQYSTTIRKTAIRFLSKYYINKLPNKSTPGTDENKELLQTRGLSFISWCQKLDIQPQPFSAYQSIIGKLNRFGLHQFIVDNFKFDRKVLIDALNNMGKHQEIIDNYKDFPKRRAGFLIMMGQYEQAMKEYGHEIFMKVRDLKRNNDLDGIKALFPNDRSQHASLLYSNQRYDEVIEQYSDMNRDYVRSLMAKGLYQQVIKEGRLQPHLVHTAMIKIGDYDRVIKITEIDDARHHLALYHKGFVLFTQGKHQEAFQAFRQSEAWPMDFGWGHHLQFPRYVMTPFLHYLKDNDKVKLLTTYKEFEHRFKEHFKGDLSDRLGILTGSLSPEAYRAKKPGREFDLGSTPGLYLGLKAELDGDKQKALESYKIPHKWMDPPTTDFIEWRIKELSR